jgi:hypothetical protein
MGKRHMKSDMVIYRTTDYKMFFFVDDNRKIVEAHVNKIAAIMKEYGYFKSMPIIVNDRDKKGRPFPNNKLLVVDSQHRLTAGEKELKEVTFCIDNAITPELISKINDAQRSWTAKDYLGKWVVHGNRHYIALAQFMTDHHPTTLSDCHEMLMGGAVTGGNTTQAFNDGKFKVIDLNLAHAIANSYKDFTKIYKEFKSKAFLRAMIRVNVSGKYNHKRMMTKMKKFGHKMRTQKTTREYLVDMQLVFNFNQKTNRVSFVTETDI